METKSRLNSFTRTTTFKFFMVGLITLFLLIPANWVKSIILEREDRNDEAISEISASWGNEQTIMGPVLTIPYINYITLKNETIPERNNLHILPENLQVSINVNPEKRSLGIFSAVVYNSVNEINGYFKLPDLSGFGINEKNILWDQAYLTLGIPDMRGIKNEVQFDWEGKKQEIIPGCNNGDIATSGFHTIIDISANSRQDELNFNINLELNGTKTLSVLPLGKTTNVKISSTWPSPRFTGNFLPYKKEINASGFSAEWIVTHLNRNYPQVFINKAFNVENSQFGVELIQPVDHYQRSYRSAKYAIMFIGLTFLVFLLIEILNKKRLHPIQYILTGIALVVFYTLLVSLSEHIGFTLAYTISAFAVVSLLAYYTWANFKKWSFTLTTFSTLASLYVFLFVILQMEDYALLLGSIGLFIVLTLFIVMTRKINWYKDEEQ